MLRKQISSNDALIVIEISLGRKLMNSILTIYLPTILLICIIHATNYFKDFFFEAVVTVNLTGMLVLTTIFMTVSSNLPQTSYVKMIDIWLLFCILVPFFEVLLHTWMDCNRSENREINHHGKSVSVDGSETVVVPFSDTRNSGLIARKENVQVDALKKMYKEANVNKNNIKRGEFLGKKLIPTLIIIFSIVYWTYGLSNYTQ